MRLRLDFRSFSGLLLGTALAIALVAAGPGCDRGGATTESAPSSLSPDAKAASERMLAAYEEIRSALARDAIGPVAESANKLQLAAQDFAATAPASLKPHASALVVHAGDLGKQPHVEKARAVFGEVSRQIVPMLVIEPSLRENLRIFECPMAQTYGKWVQPKDKIDNPYMGKAMLRCGSESEWKG